MPQQRVCEIGQRHARQVWHFCLAVAWVASRGISWLYQVTCRKLFHTMRLPQRQERHACKTFSTMGRCVGFKCRHFGRMIMNEISANTKFHFRVGSVPFFENLLIWCLCKMNLRSKTLLSMRRPWQTRYITCYATLVQALPNILAM